MRRQELGLRYTGVQIKVKVLFPAEIGRATLSQTGEDRGLDLKTG